MYITDIVFAAETTYLQHLTVAIQSLISTNKGTSFTIHVIHNGFTHADEALLRGIAGDKPIDFQFYHPDSRMLKKLVTTYHFSAANYYRLLIPGLLNADISHALYLDSDLVVAQPLDELLQTSTGDFPVAAVENPGFDRHHDLNMDSDARYLNSGVMIMNLNYWRKHHLAEKIISFIENNPSKIKYADQCGINAVLNGHWLPLKPKFNQQSVFFEQHFIKAQTTFAHGDFNEAIQVPVIVHYTGSIKPWHYVCTHPFKRLYYHYLKQTPFKRFVPEDRSLLRWVSRILRKKAPGLFSFLKRAFGGNS